MVFFVPTGRDQSAGFPFRQAQGPESLDMLGTLSLSKGTSKGLYDVLAHASVQPLDFLDLDKKSSFMNWKRLAPRL